MHVTTASLGLSKLHISDRDREGGSNQSSKKITKPKPSDDDFFVSDKENTGIPILIHCSTYMHFTNHTRYPSRKDSEVQTSHNDSSQH